MVASYVSITQLKDDALQTSVKSQILTDDDMILKTFDSGMYISSFNKLTKIFFTKLGTITKLKYPRMYKKKP